jgi:hypothetical protein
LEWIRDRIAQTFDSVTRIRVDTLIAELGSAVFDGDLKAGEKAAQDLRGVIGGVT